jgi:hypothetical protein
MENKKRRCLKKNLKEYIFRNFTQEFMFYLKFTEISGSYGNSMKVAVIWNVALCIQVITLMKKAVTPSEMLVSIYQTTQCNI